MGQRWALGKVDFTLMVDQAKEFTDRVGKMVNISKASGRYFAEDQQALMYECKIGRFDKFIKLIDR